MSIDLHNILRTAFRIAGSVYLSQNIACELLPGRSGKQSLV
jgi:hypothetical protein